jgi:hypothetical protein
MGIYVRSTCDVAEAELGCADTHEGGGGEQLTVDVTDGTPLFVFVDGFTAGDAGAFTLDFELCGDGNLTPREDCDGDDLNGFDCTTFDFDSGPLGCSSSCTFVTDDCTFDDATCTNTIGLVLGSNSGDTSLGSAVQDGSCQERGAKEIAFSFTASAAGTLALYLTSAADLGLHVRVACGDENSEIGCRDVTDGGNEESTSLFVSAGSDLTVFVDGFTADDEGAFTLEAALCGDGAIGPREECDADDFGSDDCFNRGFNAGSLECTSECTVDDSGCFNV